MTTVDSVPSVPRYIATAANRGGTATVDSSADSAASTVASAGFVSPRLRFDRETKLLVIEIRDIKNGDVQQSFPHKSTVEAYQRAARTGIPVLGVPVDRSADTRPADTSSDDRTGASPAGGTAPTPVDTTATRPAPAPTSTQATSGGTTAGSAPVTSVAA